MTEMRDLAKFVILFRDLASTNVTTEDMFTRQHLTTLRLAINNLAEDNDDEKKQKYGLKLSLNAIIMRGIKSLKGYYTEKILDEKYDKLCKFELAYTFHSAEM